MQNIEKRVIELVQEKIADRDDLFIVSVKFHPNSVLEVLLDGDQGISIDDCVQVSKFVGFQLEEEGVVEKAYRLEVSSPGIDTNFVHQRQYEKNIGRNVQVKLNDGTKTEGTLLEVEETKITIEETIKEKGKKAQQAARIIPLEQIKATKVLISFK
ncbi:ribosome assembly cofactor RimP [Sphingobacterium faecium]|uniref:ribosome assembly cofactor RimP n=1 Tax=Sphingobacterium faecium TaxID=34087 RepID=UPI00320A1A92